MASLVLFTMLYVRAVLGATATGTYVHGDGTSRISSLLAHDKVRDVCLPHGCTNLLSGECWGDSDRGDCYDCYTGADCRYDCLAYNMVMYMI